MLTIILILGLCVWTWNKYKKTPTAYPKFFSHNKWVKWNLIVQVVLAVYVAAAGTFIFNKGTEFLMHDWVGDIVGMLGLSDLTDLYGLAQDSFESDRMDMVAERTSPLMMAAMISGICAFIVLVISFYTIVNLKQKKYDESRYFTLSVVAAFGIVISTYIVELRGQEFQYETFGGDSESSASTGAIIYGLGTAVVLGYFLLKYKKNLTAIFEESAADVAQLHREEGAQSIFASSAAAETQQEAIRQCPYCGETILAIAKKCKHCGEWLPEEPTTAEPVIIQCPICGEDIEEGTEICPHCNEPVL